MTTLYESARTEDQFQISSLDIIATMNWNQSSILAQPLISAEASSAYEWCNKSLISNDDRSYNCNLSDNLNKISSNFTNDNP